MISTKNVVGAALALNLLGGLMSSAAAGPSPDAERQAREAWRETIAKSPSGLAGCFHAAYPSTTWERVACAEAPEGPLLPSHSMFTETAGDGHDFAAQASGVISETVGSFPSVSGVTSEKDGAKNDYSLQLNSNFIDTAACGGVAGCKGWQQFAYVSALRIAFMEYWLIDYGATCPKHGGWSSFTIPAGDPGSGPGCVKNSASVSVPKLPIGQLANLKLSGAVVSGGLDTLVFTTDSDAYSTTGEDSVVDLATDWSSSEFNVVGADDGTEATFNAGSSVTVKVEVTDGTTSAPTCLKNAGTTGETSNLNLGHDCKTGGGATPFIQFTESN